MKDIMFLSYYVVEVGDLEARKRIVEGLLDLV